MFEGSSFDILSTVATGKEEEEQCFRLRGRLRMVPLFDFSFRFCCTSQILCKLLCEQLMVALCVCATCMRDV